MRKEPIVFLIFAAFVGWKFNAMLSDSGSGRRSTRVKPKEYVSLQAPDVDLALADRERSLTLDRDLFSPPSPTSSLPPLGVVLPPLEPMSALAPPTGWGPIPALYGEYLRRPERPANANVVPGLFDSVAGGGAGMEGEETPSGELTTKLSDDPEARAAQIAGLKKEYDWIYTNKFEFGRILNENRYELPDLDDPELVFLPVNPATGSPLYRTPITYEPGRVDEFGLVDNALTEVEVGLARFGDPLQPGEFESALQFADSCLLKRNETPRALEVAETLYQRAQQINLQDDARPRMGLATCYQLGFRFEDAYDTYRSLLESGHETNASIHARLGVLLGQLRMKDAAEASFREGLRIERTNWEARYWYGRFLVREGRTLEALEHLQEAVRREPKAPEERAMRVRIRLAYAGALLGAGKMDESVAAFGTALSADAANEVGLAHYERLVDGLLEAGIEPWITLYHWDLPQGLEDAGGWPARGTVSAFLRYVDTVARRLGDRVHRWITVHDPWAVSMLGYQRGEHAPGRTSWPSALGAAHHLLLAHGKAVQCIRSRAADSAVGISLGLIPTYAGSDREEDQAAAVAFDGQVNRWFLDPLFGRDYPADVVSAFAGRGFLRGPHLSEIRPGDLQTISTPFDFLGVNYRSRAVVLADEGRGNAPKVARVARGDQTTDGGLEVAPTALTHLLKRIGREYSGLPLYITEVGAAFHDAPSDEGRIEDAQRLAYLYDHLRACWNAAQGGAPLRGVFVRSLFDQFEWNEGYSQQYGIVHVDRSTQERTLKDSALWLRLVMRGNALQSRRK